MPGRASITSNRASSWTALLLAVISAPHGRSAFAEARNDPQLGQPWAFEERIVFTSVDRRTVIAVDEAGTPKWERAHPGPVALQRSGPAAVLVQRGRELVELGVESGAILRTTTLPDDRAVAVDPDHGLAYAGEELPLSHVFSVLDPATWETRWQSSEIESIELVGDRSFVALVARREYRKQGTYWLDEPQLCSYDRDTGLRRWCAPLAGAGRPAAIVPIGRWLAVLDSFVSGSFFVLDSETGEIRYRRPGRFADLAEAGGRLAVLESEAGPGEARLYLCSVPDCELREPLTLRSREILRCRVHADFVITTGTGDAACFSITTGRRLWQREQVAWSIPSGDSLIVTDFVRRGRLARLVAIDLESGAERVLYTEKVKR